ncbi:hypothetical protein [Streptococcus sanguinis]|uniref:hypothetical protein n=1 Tax=Streptococcus sanguinis TaxID=1305 RepID=UPI001CBCD57A|nr:hypothetical protein [Streptococcus sanguinis]MBZ2021924.1 hypothetical protein [Streptococcus sanguinis]
MKSTRRWLIILFSILAVIGIVVGGFGMYQHQKKQEMIRIATSKEAIDYNEEQYEKDVKSIRKEAEVIEDEE